MFNKHLNRWFLSLLSWAEQIDWIVTSNKVILKILDNE